MRLHRNVLRSSHFVVVLVAALGLASAPSRALAQGSTFIRGDANLDGSFNIADPIHVLRFLFLDEPSTGCEDAADFDDDGTLLITDAVASLRFLFLDGGAPAAPQGDCGLDPTDDDALLCAAFPGCPPGGGDELCVDQELIDGILGESLAFSFCLPAGILNIPVDPLAVSVCPTDGAPPCGATQTPGCSIDITSITASVDVAGAALRIRFEGRVVDLPIQVTESLFGTTTVCSTAIHGGNATDPFSFEAVVPFEVAPVSPGVSEITGVGDGAVENIDMALTASGNLLCRLFEAGQDALISLIVTSLQQVTQTAADNLVSQLVGLRLCQGG